MLQRAGWRRVESESGGRNGKFVIGKYFEMINIGAVGSVENWDSNTCLWWCKSFHPSGGQVTI